MADRAEEGDDDAPSDRWREALHAHARRAGLTPRTDAFWLLRHGETHLNAAGIIQGQSCGGLSPAGERQAAAAARLLAGQNIRRIVLSDLRRVRQTVAPLRRALPGAAALWDPGLRERGFGAYEGDPARARLWFAEDRGAEPMAAFARRVTAAAARHLTGQGVLAAAHGGVIHVILAALHAPIAMWARGNAIPLRVEHGTAGWRVTALTEDGPVAADDPARAASGDAW